MKRPPKYGDFAFDNFVTRKNGISKNAVRVSKACGRSIKERSVDKKKKPAGVRNYKLVEEKSKHK